MDSRYDKGLELRRQAMGADYVANSLAGATDFTRPLQEIVTRSCFGEIWHRPVLDHKMRSMDVSSNTSAIADAYTHFADAVEAFVAAFEAGATQVGACFAINGRVRGLELFDNSDTCARLSAERPASRSASACRTRYVNVSGSMRAINSPFLTCELKSTNSSLI